MGLTIGCESFSWTTGTFQIMMKRCKNCFYPGKNVFHLFQRSLFNDYGDHRRGKFKPMTPRTSEMQCFFTCSV